jgi:hypothetical protein
LPEEQTAQNLEKAEKGASTPVTCDLAEGQTTKNVVVHSDVEAGTKDGSSVGPISTQAQNIVDVDAWAESGTADGSSRVPSSTTKDAKGTMDARPHNSPGQVRFVSGFLMACAAGGVMGFTFTPVELLAQKDDNSSDRLDYVWSHFVGIVATGNLALMTYILTRCDKAHLPRESVLPAIASGAIWSIAQTAWFKANEELSMVIAFPIISSLPGMIALAIGVMFLGELKTTRARVFAAAGISVRGAGIVLIALSGTDLSTGLRHYG